MSNAISQNRNSQSTDPLIVRLLQSVTQLDPKRLEDLYNSPSNGEESFEQTVIRSGVADERQIAEAYARHYMMPLFDPPSDTPPPVDPRVAEVLPSRLCRDHSIAPLSDDGQIIEVAVFSPDSLLLADEVKQTTGRQMRPLFTTPSVIERLLSVLYEEGSWASTISSNPEASFEEIDEQNYDPESLVEDEAVDETEIIQLDQALPPGSDGRIIRYINSIMKQALHRGASGIHIEPYQDKCRVRLRVDGSLTEIKPPPIQLLNSVISHLKMLSKLDTDQRRLPQSGAFGLRSGRHGVDMRVNTCPTIDGEKVVVRVLDRKTLPHDLSLLGLDERQFKDFSEAIRSQHGLILVTGPTSSGKSTTLYSCLNELNDSETNICTVEDFVKFRFAGINQVQAQSDAGLTFSNTLRSFLDQDPDVIMVGEVRDNETADACIRSALTGHSVFSTLHTKDALSSITRLKDMGVEPFLLSGTIRLLVAQRLIRRLCNQCKTPTHLDAATASRYDIAPKTVVFKPAGCSRCGETGYRGQLAVFEVIRINNEIAQMIRSGAAIEKMQNAAIADGMKLLKNAALEKVISGETGLEEALSVCVP
jgi:type IV pilus assembly protein PilB